MTLKKAIAIGALTVAIVAVGAWAVIVTKAVGNLHVRVIVLEQRVNILSAGDNHGKVQDKSQ